MATYISKLKWAWQAFLGLSTLEKLKIALEQIFLTVDQDNYGNKIHNISLIFPIIRYVLLALSNLCRVGIAAATLKYFFLNFCNFVRSFVSNSGSFISQGKTLQNNFH